MQLRLVLALTLVLGPLTACGPHRIPKKPVPQEDLIQAYRLMAEGDELLREGKDHLALLKYLEASQLNAYHEVIFNKLAVAYTRLFMYPQAKKAVERSIGLNPEYAYAYNTKGIVHLANRELKNATKSFRRAVELEPDVGNFYVNLGYAHIQRRQYEKATEAYRRALDVQPDIFREERVIELSYQAEPAEDPEKYYQMARMFAELGSLEHCLDYLQRAFKAGFNDAARIRQEDAFEGYRSNERFLSLLNLYGMDL